MTPTRQFSKIAMFFLLGVASSSFAQVSPAPAEASNETPDVSTTDKVVELETFKVNSTAIGKYAETTSSAASKVPIPTNELSSSLQILNLSAITDRKAQTIDDVLPYVVGMTKVSNRSTGFSLRGFDNSSTAFQNVQIDGLPGTTSSKSPVQTANVERLEILKGPNSVLYGQLKPGGAVNISTKSPKAIAETTITGSFATFQGRYSDFGDANSYSIGFDTTGPVTQSKKLLYRLVVVAQDAEPFRLGDYEKNYYFYPSLSYSWSKDTKLTVRAEVIREKRRSDDGLGAPFNNLDYLAPYNIVYQELTDVDRDIGEAISSEFHTEFGPWTVRLTTRSLWHRDTRFALESNSLTPTSVLPVENSTMRRRFRDAGNDLRINAFDLNAYATFGPDSFRNVVIVGAAGSRQFFGNPRRATGPAVTSLNVYNPTLGITPYPPPGTGIGDAEAVTDASGVYLSDQIKIKQRVHLVLGTRYGKTSASSRDAVLTTTPTTSQSFTSTVSQVGLMFDITHNTSVYGSWSQSFFPNSIVQVDAAGNVGFPPEQGVQYEAGLKFETTDHRLKATVAAYQIFKTNVLVNTGQKHPVVGLNIARLDGQQTSNGGEVEVEWFPISYFQVQAGGAYTKAYVSKSATASLVGKDLVSAPRLTANFWTRYNFPKGGLKGAGVGVGVIYVDDRFGGDAATTTYIDLPGYTRVDTAFYYKWGKYDFAVNIQNALDRKFISAMSTSFQIYPGDPRKITFSANYRF